MLKKLRAEYRGGGLYHVIREGTLLVLSRIFEFVYFKIIK